MRLRVLLRADAGSQIGFGHFVRTCALAGYLADDFDCYVATRNPDTGHPGEYQLGLITEAGAKLLPVYGADRATFDSDFAGVVKPDDIVVLDNYYHTTEYQRELRARARALVCIDDVHDRHFVADVVMTFCPLTRADFSLEPYTEFYGGLEWSFLRAPFLAPLPAEDSRHKDKNPLIVIAMGGADPYRLTDKMVDLVRGLRPEADIAILAGQTVKVERRERGERGERGEREAREGRVLVYRQADARTIAGLFDGAVAGIFPASTVCVEAMSRRLPVIAGHYVDNQLEIYAHGVAQRWFAPLGDLRAPENELRPRLAAALAALPKAPQFDFRGRREAIREIFHKL